VSNIGKMDGYQVYGTVYPSRKRSSMFVRRYIEGIYEVSIPMKNKFKKVTLAWHQYKRR